jgi:hypothetical protein
MAKIKIQGNASGTGVLTIEAPNTNTDRTITLPDSTDTLAGQTQVNRLGGRKNLIINGGFDVWQRGTSFTNPLTAYTADRWKSRAYNSGVMEKVSRSGTTPNYLKYSKVGADGDPYFQQKIEDGGAIYAGKTLTASFEYLHISGSTDVFQSGYGFLIQATTSGSSAHYGTTIPSTYEDLGGGWRRYKYTFTLPTTTSGHLTIGTELNPDTNVTFVIGITNFQLELGDQATEFEHRSYGEELALCQRYYQRFGEVAYVGLAAGVQGSSTTSKMIFVNPVKMRTSPSIGISNLIVTDRTAFDADVTNVSGSITSVHSSFLSVQHTAAGTNGEGIILTVKNGTTGYLAFDAEL